MAGGDEQIKLCAEVVAEEDTVGAENQVPTLQKKKEPHIAVLSDV